MRRARRYSPAVALDVEWIEDVGRFRELAAEWDALLPADSHPFDLHCWYETWWDAFGAGSEIAVCSARRGERLVGVWPLRIEAGRLRGFVNPHTPLSRPLAEDDEALAALLAAALEREPRHLELPALPRRDRAVARLCEEAHAASRRTLLEPTYVSPVVETHGEFDAWRKRSKPRWGAPLERFRRKMGREYEAGLTMIEPAVDIEAELSDGFRVEAGGWKGKEGTAIVSNPETESFYRGLAAVFAERDGLRINRIALDGETVAFDLCLLHRDRLYLLKTGFDEAFRRLAPGLVMRLSVIERCFELGLDAHELLGDASEWKLKFADAERAHATLDVYPRGPRGSAEHLYRGSLRPRLKRAYRRLRPAGSGR